MLEHTDTEIATIGVRLIDDAYVAWFNAESECETRLRSWFQATGEGREIAYVSYRAALDREEASARDLARLWRLAEPCRAAVAKQAESVPE
ncbi:MAG: hypothetical protein JO286_17940 [Solirubrobacterales bacterium]|nr:hypothetical protein [Solirubrobacterales bacterium]MBV9362800.1 hypothetical protein [Solirubrobacterales bacterium]MBV9684546.1 hypothetical protein [Solirubrobacterales bacterium]MBV9809072.1 hypothetical protein [Solirubrobacterales bacterium]